MPRFNCEASINGEPVPLPELLPIQLQIGDESGVIGVVNAPHTDGLDLAANHGAEESEFAASTNVRDRRGISKASNRESETRNMPVVCLLLIGEP
jgi:hypothetical protein